MEARMLFCRVAWMEYYRGNPTVDVVLRGGGFPDEHGFGFEMYNFLPDQRGTVYGHMESRGALHLRRIDPAASSQIDQVLVLWCANNPHNDLRIVGWYSDATVFSNARPCPRHLVGERRLPDSPLEWAYHVSASAAKAVLLPTEQRDFRVPRARSDGLGFGRHAVWYADKPGHQGYRQTVLDYVRTWRPRLGLQTTAGRPIRGSASDTERRQEVERAAVDLVKQYYRDQRWDINDVSGEKVGWDLEARRLDQLLRIEVKGLSGETVNTELTPGEYRAMKEYSPEGYCLCVVVNTLGESQRILRFTYRGQNERWEDEDSVVQLTLQERTGARITQHG